MKKDSFLRLFWVLFLMPTLLGAFGAIALDYGGSATTALVQGWGIAALSRACSVFWREERGSGCGDRCCWASSAYPSF